MKGWLHAGMGKGVHIRKRNKLNVAIHVFPLLENLLVNVEDLK